MWKRVLIIMILFALFSSFEAVAEDATKEERYYDIIKSIAPYTVNNENDKISRGDCISTIMKLIGVDKETAETYRNAFYDQPVFGDVGGGGENDGYIFVAKFSNVAIGVDDAPNGINKFMPNRSVTIQECLAFMLRCLKDFNSVNWENVMTDSMQIGLLQKDELDSFAADATLLNEDFCTLLSRMLDMKRYLHWPREEPQPGYAKSMQIDTLGSIKYVDWISENSSN